VVVLGFAYSFIVICAGRMFSPPFAHPPAHPSKTVFVLGYQLVQRLDGLCRTLIDGDLSHRFETLDPGPKASSKHTPSAPTMPRPVSIFNVRCVCISQSPSLMFEPSMTPTVTSIIVATFRMRQRNSSRCRHCQTNQTENQIPFHRNSP
jgi:hypothetical protein